MQFTCEDQINLAERELSAFLRAVTELFGPEQARLSTEDWLYESELMDGPHGATRKDWRAVTVAASARLANRVTGARSRRALASSTDPRPRFWCDAPSQRISFTETYRMQEPLKESLAWAGPQKAHPQN